MSLSQINVVIFATNAVLAFATYIREGDWSNIHATIGWGLATMCQSQLAFN